jgi:hypothetical protein
MKDVEMRLRFEVIAFYSSSVRRPPARTPHQSLASLNLHNQSNAAVIFTVYPYRLLTQAAEAGFPPAMLLVGQYHTGLCHNLRDTIDLKNPAVDFNHPRDFACAPATA